MPKSIARAFNDVAIAQGGEYGGATIAGAIDALTDALAGEDVPRPATIADAVSLMGEYVGGGGGGGGYPVDTLATMTITSQAFTTKSKYATYKGYFDYKDGSASGWLYQITNRSNNNNVSPLNWTAACGSWIVFYGSFSSVTVTYTYTDDGGTSQAETITPSQIPDTSNYVFQVPQRKSSQLTHTITILCNS